jgi:hypothetical protein
VFRTLSTILVAALLLTSRAPYSAQGQQIPDDGPVLAADNRASFPVNYREWMFLSAGLGMTYGPNAPAPGHPPSFTNVYVNPSSYRAFMKSGKWPDRTMFVLEIRGSASAGSINRSGQYQAEVQAIEVNVKDARLPGGWGFYDFGKATTPVAPLPQTARCYSCHEQNTAVEHTFVQFYPTLMEVATRLGTVKPDYRPDPAH